MKFLEMLKTWWDGIFRRTDILAALRLDPDSLQGNAMLPRIQQWKRMYSGEEYAGCGKDPKISATICSEAARLVVAEMEATVGDSPRAEFIQGLLNRQIIFRARELTEYACAIGGVLLKPRYDGVKISTDIVSQDNFLPTQYDGEGVQGGIFPERLRRGKYTYTRLEQYTHKGGGTYEVENLAFKSSNPDSLGSPVPLDSVAEWANLAPIVTIIGAPVPLFAYYRMPGANHEDMHSPFGVSLFSKATDSIRAAVTAYNALDWEVEGGRLKRYRDLSTYAPEDLDSKGNIRESARKDDIPFNGAGVSGAGAPILFDTFSPALRVEDQIKALNRHLNQIEAQTGFTQGTFSIDAKTGMATATEVVSDNQKTYSTIRDIQTKAFEPALRQLIAVYDFYATVYRLAPSGELDPSFAWDDSIVSSPDDRRARIQLLVSQGKFPAMRYLREYEGYTEEEIEKIKAELAEESPSGIEFPGGGDA